MKANLFLFSEKKVIYTLNTDEILTLKHFNKRILFLVEKSHRKKHLLVYLCVRRVKKLLIEGIEISILLLNDGPVVIGDDRGVECLSLSRSPRTLIGNNKTSIFMRPFIFFLWIFFSKRAEFRRIRFEA